MTCGSARGKTAATPSALLTSRPAGAPDDAQVTPRGLRKAFRDLFAVELAEGESRALARALGGGAERVSYAVFAQVLDRGPLAPWEPRGDPAPQRAYNPVVPPLPFLAPLPGFTAAAADAALLHARRVLRVQRVRRRRVLGHGVQVEPVWLPMPSPRRLAVVTTPPAHEFVQPCWLNDGEMKRISSGHARNDAPIASLRSRSRSRGVEAEGPGQRHGAANAGRGSRLRRRRRRGRRRFGGGCNRPRRRARK